MKRCTALVVLSLATAAVLSHRASADDWPRWRGPGGRGVSEAGPLPERWSAKTGESIAWKRDDLPGWGDSSPVVVGERIYLTSQSEDDTIHVLALARSDGRVIWDHAVGKKRLKAHDLHNMATPSCVADGEHVWALFGTGDLVCLDTRGEPIWKRDLTADHGSYEILWGMGSSPILHRDLLYVVCMHSGSSYVLALDKKTGKDVWKTPRDLPCVDEAADSYSTPFILELAKRSELIVAGADHITAYDPQTGKQLWISAGLKVDTPYGRSIASPTAAGEVVFAPSSNFGGLGRVMAVRAGGAGDVTTEQRIWSVEKDNPDCPTPLVYQGLIYYIRDNGVASCLDAESGALKWRKRIFRGDVKASPIAGDGKIYFWSRDGACAVLRAGPDGTVISENDGDGQLIATPAIADGRIFVRTKSSLYAVGSGHPGRTAER